MTRGSSRPWLPAALRACAHGIYPLEAGVGLLITQASWLHREDFHDQFIHTATSITDGVTTMAEVDWHAAISALDAGQLPCSGGEQRMLRLVSAYRSTCRARYGQSCRGSGVSAGNAVLQLGACAVIG